MVPITSAVPPDHIDLLRGAIADPFAIGGVPDGSSAIEKWYALARERASLWCFDPSAYQQLRSDDLPSSFPFRRVLGRVIKDERAELRQGGSRIVRHVIARRLGLSDPAKSASAVLATRHASGAPTVSEGEFEYLRYLPRLDATQFTVLDAPPGGDALVLDLSDYWMIGEELVELVEELHAASTPKERDAAKTALDDFLERIGASLPRGHPPKGARQAVLDALFEQGKWLFGVCWGALPTEPSSETASLLGELGIAEADRPAWATRLALPMLSSAELSELRRQASEPPGRYPNVPPRRLTIFSIAHRLGSEPASLAKRLYRSDVDWFGGRTSPFSSR